MWKRLFSALALLAMFLAPSQAGWNVHQKDTGTAVWQDDNTSDQVPVGDSGLTVMVENVSTASTSYVISHKSGKIVKIYSVLFGAITGADADLDFGTVSLSSGLHTPASGGVAMTIANSGSTAGTIDSITFDANSDSFLSVSQGDAIWVHTDGASTNDVDAMITIVIE